MVMEISCKLKLFAYMSLAARNEYLTTDRLQQTQVAQLLYNLSRFISKTLF